MCQSKRKSEIKSLVIGGETFTDAEDIAECFNDYFGNVAANLERNIPPPSSDPVDFVRADTVNSMRIFPVSPHELEKFVSNLKNSYYGIDSIPVSIFKRVFPIVSDLLLYLVNRSFKKK